jgi:hypothetical protein
MVGGTMGHDIVICSGMKPVSALFAWQMYCPIVCDRRRLKAG